MAATEERIVPQRPGMVCSLGGVLLRAADRLEHTRDGKYLGWPLRQLNEHLNQLHSEPTEANLREFLSIWR